MKIEIIICTEQGYLQAQSKLLVFSIRQFGGVLSTADIYSYSPRENKRPSKSTLRFFEKHNVQHIDTVLNKRYPDYPLANKPAVCAHREKASSADVLIFLDSDSFFLRSPDFIETLQPGEVFMRPVDKRNIGSDKQFSSPNGQYWSTLYTEFGVSDYRTVQTTVDNQEILEYYNSGVVITSPSAGLFQRWQRSFEIVMERGLQPDHGFFYTEQSVLSATISAMKLAVKPIPNEFNYPVHLINEITDPQYRIDRFSDIGHAHYHKLFRKTEGINPLHKELSDFQSGRMINEKLIEFRVVKQPRRKLYQRLWKR